jgi:beta-lactamase regulating signal transducer with metallopeptidase domain
MSAPPDLNHWHGLLAAAGLVAMDAVVKSVFWLAAAALVTSGMRRASAAARHFVWLLAVVGLFALPVLSWTLPGWDILPRWMDVKRSEPSAPDKPLATVENQLPPTERPDGTGRPGPSASLPVNTLSTSSSDPQEQIVRGMADRSLAARLSLRELGMAVWMAGFAFVLLRTLTGLASLWWLERGSRLETSSSWLELLRRLVAGLRLRRAVTLLKSHRRQMPMTWGVMRPKLLLPEESEEWPEERRRVVLLHELAHARRWDYATNLLTRLACALWWFNPLVWLAARQMAAERERACDDIVLNHGAKPAAYAEQLLGIAARGANTRELQAALTQEKKRRAIQSSKIRNRSVTAGRDAALRRPDGAARRPYLSRPPSLSDYENARISSCFSRPFWHTGATARAVVELIF